MAASQSLADRVAVPVLRTRSLLVVITLDGARPFRDGAIRVESPGAVVLRSVGGRLWALAVLASSSEEWLRLQSLPRIRLIAGDDSDSDGGHAHRCSGNAAFFDLDFEAEELRVTSSLTGLPPVFHCESGGHLIATSEIFRLAGVPGLRLRVNPRGLVQLGRIGHPIDGDTLFRDVHVMPAGHLLEVGRSRSPRLAAIWQPEERGPDSRRVDFATDASAVFLRALSRTDTSASFLSLTGGLDSRTVLAGLLALGRTLPAYTMSGRRKALDAITAAEVCAPYGIPHRTIVLSDAFERALPELAVEASRLSGGLTSIGQAHEVFFYKQLGGSYQARLSGAFGTQIVRSAPQLISMRGADLTVLDEGVRGEGEGEGGGHWYARSRLTDGKLGLRFILQNGIPYSGLANYSIGQHFAVQQTPYLHRELVELCLAREAPEGKQAAFSAAQLRRNVLRYRFLGPSSEESFQCQLVRARGGALANHPINWGWRPSGGASAVGLFRGSLALLDIVSRRKPFAPALLPLMNLLHLPTDEIIEVPLWVRRQLRPLMLDAVSSEPFRSSGIVNRRRLESLLAGPDREATATLTFVLDLALMAMNFRPAT